MKNYSLPMACKIISAIFLLFFAVRLFLYHFHMVTFPYPISLREGTMMCNTDAFVKGFNPFDMALQPEYTNHYGFIYPLLAWPFAKIFGTTMLVHRALSAFFILASCGLLFLVMQRLAIPLLLNLWAVLMHYSLLLYPVSSTPIIEPGSAGHFLFLATIFIPWLCRYSTKSLVISVLLAVIAFYTKPYDMLGAGVLTAYLFLFVSKRKSIFYVLLCGIIGLISIFIVDRTFQSYFDNCFFATFNMGAPWAQISWLFFQIHKYTHLYLWSFILLGLLTAYYVISMFIKKNNMMDGILKAGKSLNLILFAALCSCVALFRLGQHTGATLWYFNELLSPFLIICVVWFVSNFRLWYIIGMPILLYNLYTLSLDQDYKIFKNEMEGWPQLTELIKQHHLILNSPLIAPILIEQNKPIFDNGQAEYFGYGEDRASWTRLFFKKDERIGYQLDLFFAKIKTLADARKFDLILLPPNLMPIVGDDIRNNYKCLGAAPMYAVQDRRAYMISVWVPKTD